MTMTTLPKEGEYYQPSQQQNSVPSHQGTSSLELHATTCTCSLNAPIFPMPNGVGDKMLASVELSGKFKLGSCSPMTAVAGLHSPEVVQLQENSVRSNAIAVNTNSTFNGILSNGYSQPTQINIPDTSVSAACNKSTSAVSPTFTSPPYSAPTNHNFKNIFSPTEVSSASSGVYFNAQGTGTAVITIPDPALKPYQSVEIPPPVPLALATSSQPVQQAVFTQNLFPKPEPASPGAACLYSAAGPWSGPKARGPWSAPPIAQTTQTASPYPNGTGSFRPLSPISPLSQLSAPARAQSVPINGSCEPAQLTYMDTTSLRWPPPGTTFGYYEPLPAQPRKLHRVACTCPNCVNGINSKAKKKQHICYYPGCGKIYEKTSNLRAHLRWHTGERPFVCNWLFCGQRFTRSDELKRHLYIHTGERRFGCQECNKRFMRSDHLKKHIQTHGKRI